MLEIILNDPFISVCLLIALGLAALLILLDRMDARRYKRLMREWEGNRCSGICRSLTK